MTKEVVKYAPILVTAKQKEVMRLNMRGGYVRQAIFRQLNKLKQFNVALFPSIIPNTCSSSVVKSYIPAPHI